MQFSSFSIGKRSARFLTGTAMSVLAAPAVLAAPIVVFDDGDIVVDEASASGDPTAVVVESQTGAVSVSVGTVTSTSTAGQIGDAIVVSSTSGPVDVAFDTVTVSGDGEVRALNIDSVEGDISISVGTVTVDTPGGAGVFATTDTGDVSITADNVEVNSQTWIDSGEIFPEGIVAVSNQGSVTIEAGNASTTGQYGSAIIAVSGTSTSVTVDTATGTSGQTTMLYINAGTTATLDANTITSGPGGSAVCILAGESASVNVDEVISGGLGIYADSAGSIAIEVGDMEAVQGILASGGYDAETAVSLTGTVNTSLSSVDANGGSVAVEVAEGAVVSSSGGPATILANAVNGTATVTNAGQINASGTTASGIQVQATGDIVIDSALVVLESDEFQGSIYPTAGISAQSIGGGNVTINAAETLVTAPDRDGVAATAVGDGNIDITVGTVSNSGDDRVSLRGAAENGNVTLTGTDVSASGNAGVGAYGISQNGNVTIAVDTVTSTGTGYVNGHTADGVFANAVNGFADVTVGTASVAGYAASAIVALGGAGASVVADSVVNTGDYGATVYAYSSGDVSVDVGSTLLGGADAAAINAISETGNVDVVSGTIALGENGVRASGIYAVGAGDVSVTSGSVSLDEYGIFASSTGGNNVSIVSDTVEITDPAGIFAIRGRSNSNGSVSIASNSITSAQQAGYVLSSFGQFGTASITTGSITATGTDAIGVYVNTQGGISVDVDGAIDTQSRGLYLFSGEGMSEATVTGSVSSANSSAILQVGAVSQTTVAEGAELTGALTGVVQTGWTQGGSAWVLNSGTITGGLAGVAVTALGETLENPDGAIAPAPDAYIFNNGTIIGTDGLAIYTRGGSDIVELTENSVVEGLIDLGDGYDSLELGFNDDVTEGVGEVAQTVNVERLNLSSGTWIAQTGNSAYDNVLIDDGSRLVVRQVDGYTAIETPNVLVDGTLELDFDTDTDPGELTGLSIEGAGAVVLSGEAIVLFDDTSGLTYTGGTYVENGTLLLTDEYGYNVYTSGDGTFQLGDGDTAGDFTGSLVNDGTFVFARSDDYTFSGDFSGTGSFEKLGEGRILFDGLYAFDGLTTIYAGSVALSGALAADTQLQVSGGVFDLSSVQGGAQTIASLSGTGGTLILGDISLTVDQTGTTSYFGDITGSGEFIVEGTGDLKLEGDISFTGDAIINGGTLSVNGSMTEADFFVNTGGTLGGNGEVGPVVVDGGTIGAGNSIGTLTVVGDLTLSAASIFEIEVNAAGEADLVNVTGTATLGGATASILAEEGTYAPFTEYTVLTAGSVVGTFGDITTNYAFLTPQFAYDATEVSLVLRRNDIAFSDFGATGNQSAVGGLIEDLAVGSVLYNEALLLTAAEVSPAFETLTGEAYPAYLGAMVETAEMLRDQLRPAPAEGVFAWGNGLLGKVDGSGSGYRDAELSSKGVAGGLGYGNGPLQASIGLGKVWHDADDMGVSDAQTTVLSARVGYGQALGFSGEVGIQKGWSDANIARTTSLGSISENLAGEIDGDYLQVFGEAGYLFGSETAAFGPYVGLSTVNLDADDLTETGGVTALDISDLDRTVTFGRIGGKFDARMAGGLTLGGNAAYRRAWGDRENTASIAFAGNGSDVLIGALPIDKSAWELGASIGYRSGRLALEAGYAGTFSDSYDSHGGRLSLSIGF